MNTRSSQLDSLQICSGLKGHSITACRPERPSHVSPGLAIQKEPNALKGPRNDYD